eukprot:4186777-Prymnesium_polylepis.1
MLRASKEAADLNAWFNCFDVDGTGALCRRLKFRTVSFCGERSGHLDIWDQGVSMFLPNMTWLQPPGTHTAACSASLSPSMRPREKREVKGVLRVCARQARYTRCTRPPGSRTDCPSPSAAGRPR